MNIENHLWAAAVQAAGEAGMEFTVPCAHNLRDLIRAGAGVMRRENRTSEADLEEADAALASMTREMIRATRELGEGPRSAGKIPIRETALVRAKEQRPPWPFG